MAAFRNFKNFTRDAKKTRPEEPLDYKNVNYLQQLMSPQHRILSRKRTGFTGRHQRQLMRAIKQARFLALVAYTS